MSQERTLIETFGYIKKEVDVTSVEELVEALGEDLVVNQVKNQLKVSFRAVIRRKLEEQDDNGDYVNSDEAISAEDFSDWKPSLRITKTPEEKALEALGLGFRD